MADQPYILIDTITSSSGVGVSVSGPDEIAEFYVHTATVETFKGTSGYGEDLFEAPVDVPGFKDESRKLVRSATGEQVVSETTFYSYPVNAALFLPNSRVTINGAESRVIKTSTNDSGSLDLPDHIAVTLT